MPVGKFRVHRCARPSLRAAMFRAIALTMVGALAATEMSDHKRLRGVVVRKDFVYQLIAVDELSQHSRPRRLYSGRFPESRMARPCWIPGAFTAGPYESATCCAPGMNLRRMASA